MSEAFELGDEALGLAFGVAAVNCAAQGAIPRSDGLLTQPTGEARDAGICETAVAVLAAAALVLLLVT